MPKQIFINLPVHDHARPRVVGELRVVDGTDRLVEGLGLWKVANGQIDEDLLGHGGP